MPVLFSPDGLGTMLHMVIRALAMAANEEYHNSQYRSLFRLEPPFCSSKPQVLALVVDTEAVSYPGCRQVYQCATLMSPNNDETVVCGSFMFCSG